MEQLHAISPAATTAATATAGAATSTTTAAVKVLAAVERLFVLTAGSLSRRSFH